MNSYFFIVADRGNLKAYRAEEAPARRSPRVKLVEAIPLVGAHLSTGKIFTDEAGAFLRQTGAGPRQTVQGNSIAERHYDIEEDRRCAKQLAEHIENVLHREKRTNGPLQRLRTFRDRSSRRLSRTFAENCASESRATS